MWILFILRFLFNGGSLLGLWGKRMEEFGRLSWCGVLSQSFNCDFSGLLFEVGLVGVIWIVGLANYSDDYIIFRRNAAFKVV